MNTDSKPLKRYVTLLNKAPFILFMETKDFPIGSDNLKRILSSISLSMKDVERSIKVEVDSTVQKILYYTNELPDTIAYHIADALATTLPHGNYFNAQKCFTSANWQKEIKWQNIDIKPAPISHFTITVDKFTHRISIIDDVNTPIDEGDYDSIIPISGTANIPLPKALLNTCVVHIYENIIGKIKLRTFDSITQSKYVSVMQTGHDSFNWVNLKKLEKDLKTAIEAYGVIIEQ